MKKEIIALSASIAGIVALNSFTSKVLIPGLAAEIHRNFMSAPSSEEEEI